MDNIVVVEVDLIEWIEAACRAAITALPRGERGVEAAILWLRALPEACRLNLGDVTDSAPGLFRLFVAAGLIPSCPSDGAMTGAIRLITSVSPLVTKRSARTWTAWLRSACDPDSAIAATLRGSVTPTMLARSRPALPDAPRRAGSIRSERDRLAAELQVAREALGRERASAAQLDELAAERDRLAADLANAGEERRFDAEQIDILTAERDRLAADLANAGDERQRQRRSVDVLTAERDRIAADLNAAAERHRVALVGRDRALAEVRAELAQRQRELQEAERRRSEADKGARARSDRIKAITEARDHHKAELDRQTQRVNLLREELTAAEATISEQTSRADAAVQRAATLTTRCRELDAELATAIAERDRYTASLTSAKTSLTRTRTDLEGSQEALAREKAAHHGTRQSLAFVEKGRFKLQQEHHQLTAVALAAEGACRALAQICEWLDIVPSDHADVEAKVDAILAAIDRNQTISRELVARMEHRLLVRTRQCCVALYTNVLYKNAYPDVDFSAQVDRAGDDIHEHAEQIVQADMEKLTSSGARDTDA